MADKSERSNKSREGLTIKVDVDISEALTGLKALQREAKKATQVLRELEEAHKIGIDLSNVPTTYLHRELITREGVEEYGVDAHGGYGKITIHNAEGGDNFFVEGPARIVVNRD